MDQEKKQVTIGNQEKDQVTVGKQEKKQGTSDKQETARKKGKKRTLDKEKVAKGKALYKEKKKQEKLGEEKNRQISVAAYETYRDITATAVEEKMDAPSIKNLIENRKEERFLTNYQNSIESRLTDTELEPVVIEPSVPKQATSLFDVESINPDSCDFWSKVDHASREENRKKQELLRNGGQS